MCIEEEQFHLKIGHDKCEFCNKTFSCKYNLQGHIKAVHKKEKFKCEHCEKEFTNSATVKRHIKIQHGENQKIFRCDLCEKTFTLEKTVTIHKDMVHLKKKPHQCEICKSNHLTKSTLKKHMKRMH